MFIFQATLLSLAALLAIFFGIRYLLAKEFMPYHAVVAGQPWSGLSPGVQTVILGMLRIIGGSFIAYGLMLLWLLLPLSRHEAWASWATLSISAMSIVPTVYVTLWLRRFAPAARTPVLPSVVVLVLVAVGAASSLFP